MFMGKSGDPDGGRPSAGTGSAASRCQAEPWFLDGAVLRTAPFAAERARRSFSPERPASWRPSASCRTNGAIPCGADETILGAALRPGVAFAHACGGNGSYATFTRTAGGASRRSPSPGHRW
jgi:hypothetical protein